MCLKSITLTVVFRIECWDKEAESCDHLRIMGKETSGYILKVELRGFANRWNVGWRKKERGLKEGCKILGVSKWKERNQSSHTHTHTHQNRKKDFGWRNRYRNSVLASLSLDCLGEPVHVLPHISPTLILPIPLDCTLKGRGHHS